jgi:uncharacterized membrane protein (UPF0127 family)
MKLALKYILIIALFGLPVCAENSVLILKNSAGKEISLQIEIADTDIKRSQGLMYRRKLDTNSGMLFVFPQDQHMNFWMKNTYIPLSIAFIDKQGKISEILNMKPLDDSIIYSSKSKARYALEVNLGWFNKNSINAGCRILNIDGCIGK